MTTTVGTYGRFCNQFIRNIAVSILAKKYNLKVTYMHTDEMATLGIPLYSGSNSYLGSTPLNDVNYMHYYNDLNPLYKNFSMTGHTYFQTRQISNIIHNYLKSPEIRDTIIGANKFRGRYNNNEDIFIHIRLGDVANYNPGVGYYDKVIKMLLSKNPANIFISSDDIDHITCKILLAKYRIATPIQYNHIETLQFASTCKYIILSHGSFSATIGNLAFYSEVYYPKYDPRKIWYGDMFTGLGWKEIPHLIY